MVINIKKTIYVKTIFHANLLSFGACFVNHISYISRKTYKGYLLVYLFFRLLLYFSYFNVYHLVAWQIQLRILLHSYI